MSFVTVKEQQGLSVLHSARSQLIGRRTQLVKALRVHQSEIGNVAARGRLGPAGLAASVRNKSGSEHRQEAYNSRIKCVRWHYTAFVSSTIALNGASIS
jgi:hypothetical protein